ncbi:hypothetical protein K432DRAFT_415885 [Lepidopterella palustris CBS 459.81]|uniref:Uncharacterized protein n=1 Tax=Lepidopterella palustris CBS 459.81 TaxID=1314670 RepID=A0A8E2EDP3_9PEZI|nr:hypothetical protein K432DRAFT_415885 [Lepidopterella palustris CBS 459.81]
MQHSFGQEISRNCGSGSTNNSNPRYQPCYLLRDYGIPCAVWFEDTIVYYGVPTVTAAQALIQNGWTLAPQEKVKIRNANYQTPAGPITTVLLPAADWNFNLKVYGPDNTKTLVTTVLPPIAGLLDALIDSLFWAPALQERAFAERLVYDHRQYHFDVLSGMSNGTVLFISHQRNVQQALRQGSHEFRECSARDNKALFSGEREAQLLASMPNPFPAREGK